MKPLAYLSPTNIKLPQRMAFGHKGSYGHVLVVGGHEQMGGAVIMAAEAAFHAGQASDSGLSSQPSSGHFVAGT